LPLSMTAAEVRSTFRGDSESWAALASHFEHAPDQAVYPVRGVIMFGIAECARAVRAADCLRRQDMQGLGELMKISHDGERCFTTHPNGSIEPFCADVSDEALHRLIADLTSHDSSRIQGAQLHNQPGAYRCSTREIDAIVDIACRTPGVAGAQIAGAGLGGCAMILVRESSVGSLNENLTREYYAANGLPPAIIECSPSAGSCLVSIA